MASLRSITVVVALLLFSGAGAHAQIYVDADATGANDGSTWADAYTDLQTALDNAADGDQIWVAEGVYTPATAEDSLAFGGAKDGLELYGGFSGTESALSGRDPEANVTVLSGDVGGDDTRTADGVTEGPADVSGNNANHVLWLDGTSDAITSATVLDGVTVTAGQADGTDTGENGGGLYCNAGGGNTCNPTLRNVTFIGNEASNYGGALFNRGAELSETGQASPTIVDAAFVNNAATSGGAVYNYGNPADATASPTVKNTVFLDNDASGGGGAIYNSTLNGGTTNPTLVNVVFDGNNSDGSAGGGAIRNGGDGTAETTVVNAAFSSNTATRGGALSNRGSGAILTLINATITGNSASSFSFEAEGGALFNEGSATVENTILWGNSASDGGGEIHNDGGTATVGYSIVEGGANGTKIENVNSGSVTDDGDNLDQDPLFVASTDPAGRDGTWATPDDGLNVAPTSPAIDAGDDAALPSDVTDLDDDGDTGESIPLDLTGAARSQDIDDNGTAAVNIGAYEGAAPPSISDVTPSGPYPGHPVTLTGRALVDVSSVAYGGTSVPHAIGAGGGVRTRIPAGATADEAFTITTTGGSASSSTVTLADGPYGAGAALRFEPGGGASIGSAGVEPRDSHEGSPGYVATGASGDELGLANESFSIDAWFRAGDLSGAHTLVGIDGGTPTETLDLGLTSDGRVRFGFGDTSLETAAGRVSAGTWYHVAFVYDAAAGDRTLYLNGAPAASDNVGTDFQGTGEMLLGRLNGSEPFLGTLDQVRVWQGGLTATEVRARMHRTVGPGDGAASERTAAYRFDVSDPPAYDHSSSFYHGTPNNSPVWVDASGARLGQESATTQGTDASVGPGGGSLSVTDVSAGADEVIQLYRFGAPDDPPRTDADPGELLPGAETPERTNLTWGLSAVGDPAAEVTIRYDGISTPTLDEPTLLRRDGPGTPWEPASGWTHDADAQTFTKSGSVANGQYALKDGPLQDQLYVDADATGAGDGTSWTDAYTSLQEALADATAAHEIWIAEGVYSPDEGSSVPEDDPSVSFQINGTKNGIALYGGFEGTESTREERDPTLHRTVLSGDVAGDDADPDGDGIIADTTDISGVNSHHVLQLGGPMPITGETVIDGVVVTAGQATGGVGDDRGGGLLCVGAGADNECSPTLRTVVFAGNAAAGSGAALSVEGANSGTGSPTITNAVFVGNQAVGDGGAVYSTGESDGTARPRLQNVVFARNTASNGGALYNVEAAPRLVNATLSANRASADGGAIYNDGGSTPPITNTILWKNTAAGSGSEIYEGSASSIVTHSIVEGGDGGIANGTAFSAGSGNLDADPAFAGGAPLAGADGRIATVDDSLNLAPGSPALDAGINDSVSVSTDLTGADRVQDLEGNGTATVNLGAYETPEVGSPVVTTEAPSSVTGTSATLSGTVDPAGGPTRVYLSLKERSSGDSTFAPVDTLRSDLRTVQSVQRTVDTLASDTEYRYTLAAANAADSVAGGARTFTTDAVLPSVRPDSVRARRGVSRRLDVLANDEAPAGLDSGTVVVETEPDHGTASVDGADGTIAYEHDGSDHLTDVFTYTVADEAGRRSEPATVTIDAVDLQVRTDEANREEPVSVEVGVRGGFAPETATLYARRGGTTTYRSVSANVEETAGDTAVVRGTVPDSLVTTRGIDYYATLSDARGTLTVPVGGEERARRQPRHLPVSFPELSAPESISFAPERYRMVTVPAVSAEGLKANLRATYGGEYEPLVWRLLRWTPTAGPDGAYREYPEIDSLRAGQGFWLITKEGTPPSLPDGGRTVDAGHAQAVPLEAGWNQIGNPFGFAVPWDTVRAASGLAEATIDGPVAYRDGRYRTSRTTLAPWEGYFVFSVEADTLTVPPVGSEAAEKHSDDRSTPLAGALRSPTSENAPLQETASDASEEEERYTLTVEAASEEGRARVLLGLWPEAKGGRDRFDLAQPPPIEAGLQLSALEEVAGRTVPHAGSAKPPRAEAAREGRGQSWTLRLSGPEDGEEEAHEVKLRLGEEGTLPQGYGTYVLDLDRETRVAPGALLSLEDTRHLKVLVGTEAYAERENDGIDLSALETTLRGSYPNPFEERATIEYVLAEAQEIRIEVYNVLGQRVRTLVDGEKKAGVHRLEWDGRNQYGTRVGSGVYFYRMHTQETVETRKMVHVR